MAAQRRRQIESAVLVFSLFLPAKVDFIGHGKGKSLAVKCRRVRQRPVGKVRSTFAQTTQAT
jgi:hypothetical protein